MRWYNFYFSIPESFSNAWEPESRSQIETMGVKAENKEEAIKKFFSKFSEYQAHYISIISIEEGHLEEKIMKLTKEDIQKYGTEEEKKILKEGRTPLLDMFDKGFEAGYKKGYEDCEKEFKRNKIENEELGLP